GLGSIIAKSQAMRDVVALVQRVASSTASVLITGESGTGKELIARAIHYNSPRAAAPFVGVNLAAVPEGLIESELFGHQKGAFTDARAEVRVIPATTKNLEEMLADGSFREALYYRLNVIHLDLPPLRSRPEDIIPLAEHVLVTLGAKQNRRMRLSPEAQHLLL